MATAARASARTRTVVARRVKFVAAKFASANRIAPVPPVGTSIEVLPDASFCDIPSEVNSTYSARSTDPWTSIHQRSSRAVPSRSGTAPEATTLFSQGRPTSSDALADDWVGVEWFAASIAVKSELKPAGVT